MKTLWTWSRNKYEQSTTSSNSVRRKTWYVDQRVSSNLEKNYIHSRDSRPARQREREIEHLLHACVTSLLTKMQNKLGYDIDDGIYIRGSNFQSVPSHMLNFLKTTCQNSKSKPGTRNVVFSFRFFSQFSLPGGSEPFPLTFYQYYFFMLLLNLLQKCCFLFTSTTFFFFLVLNLLEKMLFPF